MEPRNAIIVLALLISGCVVNSPVPYKGDVDAKNVPLRPVFDPEGASYQQPPFPVVPERAQRQEQQESPDEKVEYDYFYIHTKEGLELRRKSKPQIQ